jgi:hypothetical protein
MLGLKPDDSWLFQHAMMLEALPIPPLINEDNSYDQVRYFFNKQIINNVYKPGLFYVKKTISVLKVLNKDKYKENPEFIFYDKLKREFTVNLRSIYEKWLESSKNRNLIEYYLSTIKTNFLEGTHDLHRAVMNSKHKVSEIMSKNY